VKHWNTSTNVKLLDINFKKINEGLTESVISYINSQCYMLNQTAMEILNGGKINESLKVLKNVLTLLLENQCQKIAQLLSLTYNNISCIYKKYS